MRHPSDEQMFQTAAHVGEYGELATRWRFFESAEVLRHCGGCAECRAELDGLVPLFRDQPAEEE